MNTLKNVDKSEVILSVKNLVKDFPLGQSVKSNMMRAVNDVSFDLRKGEALAIVGESGSGKAQELEFLPEFTIRRLEISNSKVSLCLTILKNMVSLNMHAKCK